MKILYLSSSNIPSTAANSVHVMKMCEALTMIGHSVTLVTQRKKGAATAHDPFLFYGIKSRFNLKPLPLFPLGYRGHLFRMALTLIVMQPDLVYCRSLHGCYLASVLGFDSVFESHSPVWEKGTKEDAIFKKLLARKKLRKLVVISNALRKAYEKRYELNPNRICVAPDAASPIRDLETKAKLPGRTEALTVGITTSLSEGKGLEVIQRIAPLLPDVDFHIIGGTKKQILEWQKRVPFENVFFLGFIEQAHLAPYRNAFDICLVPNQRVVRPHGKDTIDIGLYTSPLKMFEYMAQKKAIVASDLPILREILNENVALFASPDNPNEWVAAIHNLRDTKKRRALGEAAYILYKKHYTWEERARRVLSCIMRK